MHTFNIKHSCFYPKVHESFSEFCVLYYRQTCLMQLNHAKTEVLWCTSSRRQHQIPSGPVRIGTTDVHPVSSTHDLGVYIDSTLTCP